MLSKYIFNSTTLNNYVHKTVFFLFLFLLLLIGSAKISFAHSPNQSYIFLRINEDSISGRYEVTAADINSVFDLDLKPGLKKEDLSPYLTKIQEYILQKSSISSKEDGEYKVRFTEPTILHDGTKGDFIQLNFDLEGIKELPETLIIKYEAIFTEIPSHQAMLAVEYNWRAGILDGGEIVALVFLPNDTVQELPTSKSAGLFLGFIAMIKLGIWHIWIGIDHILFLVALLLPAVLRAKSLEDDLAIESQKGFWSPVEKFRPALINVVKIVTFFTIAHTITLSLASLEIFTLPSRLVESVIAISIALAAFHNIRPLVFGKEWIIAFVFGLFHGFGFASVLADKGFGGDFLIWTLLGFNIGVEIGQLAIILLVFPILFFLRKTNLYPKILLFGSIFLILISIYWFIERAFEVDLPLGGYVLRALGVL